jgi:hypothetical protein
VLVLGQCSLIERAEQGFRQAILPVLLENTRLEAKTGDRACPIQARTSMVDGFPYKEEVGGSNPSVPTSLKFEILDNGFLVRIGPLSN